jgi:D-galactarolactone cycloisomerase
MKIQSIQVDTLVYEYPEEARIQCAEGSIGKRVTSLVRIRVSPDLVGLGSAYTHPEILRTIVEDHLGPFLVGSDAGDLEGLWNKMYSLTRWYGRKGAAISAIGAVDTALWDIRGKVAGKPVFELLGGSTSVPAYASALLWQDIDRLADEARRYVDEGFRLMKMRLGRRLDYDFGAVDAVGDAIGGRARLAVDGTHRYSEQTAVQLAEHLADRDVAWFEEPFPPEDVDAYARLRAAVTIPIAAGENEFGEQGFRELFRAGAVDVAQPDVSRAGGISECLKIAELARQAGVQIATHTWSDAVAIVANAHFASTVSDTLGVEVDRTATPLTEALLTVPLDIREGRLHLPRGPGLGIELDEDVVSRLRVPPRSSTPSGNYADLVFGNEPYEAVPPYAAQVY